MVPFRRWRPLILVVSLWLTICWYFLRQDTSGQSFSPSGTTRDRASPTTVRWKKLPERHPVSSLRPLPAVATPAPAISRIQKSPVPEESDDARTLRLSRLAAVKESFEHSWAGYKEHAWLHDEVMPISGEPHDPFGGWAATLVDSLDALWIMGLRDDFERAVRACERIDFTLITGGPLNVFETTIRYMGGFLAAYELSDKAYPVLLAKATEVGELLMCAFDTPNRMPIPRWNVHQYMSGGDQEAPTSMLLAELGSLAVEFTKLSQLTGDGRYFDAVERINDELQRSQQNTKLPGMWPVMVNANQLKFNVDRTFTLGGMSDSTYEYFAKQYLILGGALDRPRDLYKGFIDVAKQNLFRRVLNKDNIPLVASGDAFVSGGFSTMERTVGYTARAQHLTCFVGGMVGVAARIFDRPADLDLALQLTDACVWAYRSTTSGIMPEIFSFVDCGPITESQTGEACVWSEKKWQDAISEDLRLSKDDPGRDDMLHNYITKRRLPPGMTEINDRKYILRPEAIESVFIMYRLTGDPAWMDKAWDMFTAIEKHTRTTIAAASLDDVTRKHPHKTDSMESFWLAETLKYFFLIFSDFDVVNLDEWVLNTEAHPLRRPDV